MKKPLWSIVFSFFSLVPMQAIATEAPQPVQEQQGNLEMPVIKVTTRLVQVNVVVHHKMGEPVRDLAKEDFVLFDKGQEQKILFFSKESTEALPTNLPPLAPGVVSNRYANFTSGGEKHLAPLPTSLTVVLLDGLNTAFTDQLLLVAFDDKGKPVHQLLRTIHLSLDETTYDQALKSGMIVSVQSDAPATSHERG